MIVSTVIDYVCGLIISNGFKKGDLLPLKKNIKRTEIQKAGLIISLISRLGFLGYFKYYNFFIENFNVFVQSAGLEGLVSPGTAQIALPLGISFYTFQSMSYTIDVYQGKVTATRSISKFAGYVTMFPQLIAGPIVRYSDIEQQINHHQIKSCDFVDGIKRFVMGLSKKVLIANTLAVVADRIFELPQTQLSMGLAWTGVIAYTLQIYFDFSGYSCMAIGLGKMIGFTFPENFNFPYISRSIKEFWRRWHISLSSWFRDYLYIPLGGSRKGSLNNYRNLIIVFFMCGLWHGASWNFVIWGLFHGFFLVAERMGFLRFLEKIPPLFQHAYVLLVISISWVFFRTETLPRALLYIKSMFGMGTGIQDNFLMLELLQMNVLLAFAFGIFFSTPLVADTLPRIKVQSSRAKAVCSIGYLCILTALFSLCTMSLASGTYNPFIYFRF